MAYIAVDKNGCTNIFQNKPVRYVSKSLGYSGNWIRRETTYHTNVVNVPKGTAYKLTGKQMTWEDEPFKL